MKEAHVHKPRGTLPGCSIYSHTMNWSLRGLVLCTTEETLTFTDSHS